MKRRAWNIKRGLLIKVLKLLVFILTVVILYNELFLKDDLQSLWNHFQSGLLEINYLWLILGLSIVVLNWGSETLKWKVLIADYEKVKTFTALKAVLAGVFLGFFTPNRLGEFAGRLVYVKTKRKTEVALLTVAGNILHMHLILHVGFASILYTFRHYNWVWVLWILYFPITLYMVHLYLNLHKLNGVVRRLKLPRLLFRYFIAFRNIGKSRMRQFLILSFARYTLFTIQYFLLLKAFHAEIDFPQTWVAVSSLLFIQTLLPTLAIAEVTLRGSVALKTFEPFLTNDILILSVTYSVWLINILIPTLAGGILFLINRAKDVAD